MVLTAIGTYKLDPSLPLVKADRCGRGWHRNETLPTASFKARHGSITTKLAITGDSVCVEPATIRALARSGDILMDIVRLYSQCLPSDCMYSSSVQTEKTAERHLDV